MLNVAYHTSLIQLVLINEVLCLESQRLDRSLERPTNSRSIGISIDFSKRIILLLEIRRFCCNGYILRPIDLAFISIADNMSDASMFAAFIIISRRLFPDLS